MRAKLGEILLAGALFAVLFWPAITTLGQAAGEVRASWGQSVSSQDEARRETPAGRYLGARPWSLARNTIALVGLTGLMALPPGCVLAWVLFRTDVPGGRFLLALLGLVLFVPMPLHAVAWLGSFGNPGRSQALGWVPVLVGMPGAAFVHAVAALPWVVFLVGVGLSRVEPELEDAAVLDYPLLWVAVHVSLRRAMGSIVGAMLVVTVLTAGDMTVTDLLQVRTYAEESYIQAQLTMGQGASAVIAAGPMIAVLGVLIVWAARALLRADPARLPSGTLEPRRWSLGRWRLPVGAGCLLLVGNLVSLPIYGLIWRAGRVGSPPVWSLGGLTGSVARAWPDLISPTSLGPWYETLDSRPLVATLAWSALGATIAVSMAWPLAWLSRDRVAWRSVAAMSAALALAAPGPVVGESLKRAYLNLPLVHDSSAILVLAYVARTLPFALLILWPAVRTLPIEHLETARLDGMGGWRQFRRIGLPMTARAIVAAWSVAFVLAMGELPAANFVAEPGRWPVSLEVWRLLHTGVESRLAGVGLLLLAGVGMAASLAAVAVSRAFRLRSEE